MCVIPGQLFGPAVYDVDVLEAKRLYDNGKKIGLLPCPVEQSDMCSREHYRHGEAGEPGSGPDIHEALTVSQVTGAFGRR